jgi:hypothetical protein
MNNVNQRIVTMEGATAICNIVDTVVPSADDLSKNGMYGS